MSLPHSLGYARPLLPGFCEIGLNTAYVDAHFHFDSDHEGH